MRSIHPAGSQSFSLSDGRAVEVVEPIGRGSLGEVHRGILESAFGIRRMVAVKTFDVSAETDTTALHRRVAGIARRAAGIAHPAVVQVLEIDRVTSPHGPKPVMLTELVDGESLQVILAGWRAKRMRAPLDFALVVGLRIAEALAAGLLAESALGNALGAIHGDLSPRQVFISKHGEVKVGDFGLGVLRHPSTLVRSREAMAYTSPEVAVGFEAEARSDVYSLGVILHEMLVGPRFADGASFHVAAKMMRDGSLETPVMGPSLPRELRAILHGALAPTPADRYPQARALAFDLRREVMRLGMLDVQTSVRHAIVGPMDTTPPAKATEIPVPLKSDVVPRSRPGVDLDGEESTPPSQRHG